MTSYTQLLNEVSQYLRPVLKGQMGGMDQSEDVLQEVLLTLHRARHSFDPSLPFKPWLYRIMQSRLMEFWRRHKGRYSKEDGNQLLHIEQLEAEAEISHLEKDMLVKALDELNEAQRKIVELLKVEGLSIREVALQMQMSESAVKVSAHRAYKVIYQHLRGSP